MNKNDKPYVDSYDPLLGEHEGRHSQDKQYCRFCGKELTQDFNHKRKEFCNDYCRYEYWNMVRSKTYKDKNGPVIYTKCKHCGKRFVYYPNRPKKYCCKFCYDMEKRKGNV